MDCTDLRAILSGFIDGELSPERQHATERHLVECSECREKVARAEALDATLRSAAARWGREDRIPGSIVECVLARTVADVASLHRARRSAFAGWLTAAAALGLATTLWFTQGTGVLDMPRGRAGGNLAGNSVGNASPKVPARETIASAADGAVPRSTTRPAPAPPSPPLLPAPRSAPTIDERDSATLVAVDDGGIAERGLEVSGIDDSTLARSTQPSSSGLGPGLGQGLGHADDQVPRESDDADSLPTEVLAQPTLAKAGPPSVHPLSGPPLHGPPRWLGFVGAPAGNPSSDGIFEADWTGGLAREDLVARLQEGGDAIFLASVLLSRLEFADPGDSTELERIRQIVQYDRLLDRLDEIRPLLAEPQSRGAVEVAESMLLKLEQGPLGPDELAELQQAIGRIELPTRLEETVRRLEGRSPT